MNSKIQLDDSFFNQLNFHYRSNNSRIFQLEGMVFSAPPIYGLSATGIFTNPSLILIMTSA